MWQQLIDGVDWMISDAAEHIGEPRERIDAAALTSGHQGRKDRIGFAAARAPDEEPVPAVMYTCT
jgi:hypothetical protein